VGNGYGDGGLSDAAPGPTILTNRDIISRADNVRMASSRPIIRVNLGGSLWNRSETATSLDGKDCCVESVTGATKQYHGPNARDQLSLSDDFSGSLNQRDQRVERTAT
jgi:hypothetical protein